MIGGMVAEAVTTASWFEPLRVRISWEIGYICETVGPVISEFLHRGVILEVE